MRSVSDPPLPRRAGLLEICCRMGIHVYRWVASLKPLMIELVYPRVSITGTQTAGRILFGYGLTWFAMAFRMLLFVAALMPGFLQLTYYYVRSPQIIRGVKFGPNPRNSLDIYSPSGVEQDTPGAKKVPVFIFFTGGAWIIGYKAWGALLGRTLCSFGVLVVCPDYRNFPGGRVGEMLADVDRSIDWVFENAAKYGGDTSDVTLGGQSAGAHLSALSLLRRCQLTGAAGPKKRLSQAVRRNGSKCRPPAPTRLAAPMGWSVARHRSRRRSPRSARHSASVDGRCSPTSPT